MPFHPFDPQFHLRSEPVSVPPPSKYDGLKGSSNTRDRLSPAMEPASALPTAASEAIPPAGRSQPSIPPDLPPCPCGKRPGVLGIVFGGLPYPYEARLGCESCGIRDTYVRVLGVDVDEAWELAAEQWRRRVTNELVARKRDERRAGA